ncbi:hypothetical protein V6N11_056161 [Hibiscus sabdariffa]|uniref:Uncharacterized protein n=1 Tax=Hibiscus sabdariffa TaxID=183260 RepID=A0ABR2T303_9ROSI
METVAQGRVQHIEMGGTGPYFVDKFPTFLKQERKEYVTKESVPNDPGANAPKADKDKFKKYMDDMVDVRCLMLATMTPEL